MIELITPLNHRGDSRSHCNLLSVNSTMTGIAVSREAHFTLLEYNNNLAGNTNQCWALNYSWFLRHRLSHLPMDYNIGTYRHGSTGEGKRQGTTAEPEAPSHRTQNVATRKRRRRCTVSKLSCCTFSPSRSEDQLVPCFDGQWRSKKVPVVYNRRDAKQSAWNPA